MTAKGNIEHLKNQYVDYYRDVPVQKYAAMYIGRDEDTIIRWRNQDKSFADRVNQSKAEWIRKRLIASKAEFALERLAKEVFSERVLVEPINPIRLILEKYGLTDVENAKIDV